MCAAQMQPDWLSLEENSAGAEVLTMVERRFETTMVDRLLGLGLTQVVCHELGRLTYQARPFVVMHFTPLFPHVPNNSFPSSLTAFAAVAAVIGVLAWRRLGMVFVVGLLVVGFGCVYVGVHYPSDVIAGAGAGVVSGWVTWLIAGLPPMTMLFRAIERRLPKRRRSMASPAGPRPRDQARVATGAS